MDDDADPIVGTWYLRRDEDRAFQVVALDEAAGLVEAQHFDGDLEEIELEAWHDLDAEPIEAPEDWSGPLDAGETDDLTGTSGEDWPGPQEEVANPGLDRPGEDLADPGLAASAGQPPAPEASGAGSQEEDVDRPPAPPKAWTED
jgi:hypothetical protein